MKHKFSPRTAAFPAPANWLLFGLVCLLAAHAVTPLHGAQRFWTGLTSAFWSNPNNWSPVGVPQDGEDLIFQGSLNESMVNDLLSLRVNSLTLREHDYVLSGNSLLIDDRIDLPLVHNENYVVIINCVIRLGRDLTIAVGAGSGLFIQNPNELHLRGEVRLNGHHLQLDATAASLDDETLSSKIFVSGSISGPGDVTAMPRDDCSIVFDGPEGNTFSGTLRAISLGDDTDPPRIRFNKSSGAVVTNRVEVFGRVVLDRDDQIGDQATVALGAIANFGPVALDRSFLNFQGHSDTFTHLVFTNRNLIADAAFLDTAGGTLTLLGDIITDTVDVTPVLKGVIDLPAGNHTFDIGGTRFYGIDVQAQLTGTGGFTKTGNAALLLQTNNSFTGSVTVEEGIVEARHALAFGTAAGGVALTGNGSLTLDNVRINSETLFVRGTRSVTANTDGAFLHGVGNLPGWMGRIELDTNLVVLSDDLCVLGGPVVGPGGFEFLGQQNVLFGSGLSSAPSTYTGTVRVLCDLLTVFGDRAFRGPLIVGGGFGSQCEVRWGNSTLNSGVPEVTVHPNGLVNLDGRGETFTRLIMHGGRVITGTGFVSVARIITNPTNVTASIEGNLVLGSTPTTEFTVADGPVTPDLVVSAVVTDGINNIGILKTGDGELLLSGANTYDGTTRIDAGVVHIQNNTSLGTPGVGTTVRDGATLQIEFVGALAEPLDIRGAGRGGTLGALNLMAATGVQAGIVLAADATVRNDASFAILSGVISGPGGLTKTGAGALQLGGGSGAANTYGGDTIVLAGEVVLSKGAGVTTVPGHLTIGGGGGFLSTPATVRHFAGNTIIGSVTVNRGGLWDLNGFSESFSVADLQGRPPLTLNDGGDVQTGAGTLVLPVGGDVVVNPGSGLGFTSFISGNLGLDPGPHRFIVQSGVSGIGFDFAELDVSAVISQTSTAADIVKEGSGEMRLSGANSFTGSVTVNGGRGTAANALALGTAAGGTFVNGDASLALDGGITVSDESLTLNSTSAFALLSLGPVTNVWFGNIILQRTAGFHVADAGGVLTHSGILGFGTPAASISGPGGLTKAGPGALFITVVLGGGANSFTGPTTITDGLLEATRGRAVSEDITVTGANATLRTGRATGNILTSIPTVLPRGANVAIENGALWTMTGTNFETISRLVGDGRLTVSTAGALTISNSVSCEFSGQISGSGALNKLGLATLQLTGNSPGYTGVATVFDGTYKVDGYFAGSPVTVKAGSLLRGSGAVGDVTVESAGVVRVDSDNPGVLGGSMQFNSVNFQGGSVLGAQFYGPHPTGGNDSLYVLNGVTLSTPALSSGFQYPPHEGDVVTLIDKIGAGATSGAFSGFPEGALRFMGGVPVVTSYVGGDGNDVTLTVANLPLRGGGAQFRSSRGGMNLVPNDCGTLTLVVTNRGATALTGLRGSLRSLTEGVTVTMAQSAYPNLAPNARGSNATSFQIRIEPAFPCGGGAQFELVLTSAEFPPIAIVYTLPGASGFGLTFDGRDDLVQVAVNAFPGVSNNFTIELWANPTATRTETAETNAGISGVNVALRQLQRFAVFPDQGTLSYGANHAGAGLSIGRNGVSVYEHAANHLPSRLVYSNDLSGWTHVALVYSSRRPRLYVNGALVRSGLTSLFPFVHASASLGSSSQSVNFGNFKGQLDEVRIWNVALSETQIQTNMSRSLTGTEPGLVTYFRCDEGNGGTLADTAPASPNPAGTLTDGAAFVFPGVTPFGDTDCNGGGACESCFVVSGQFDTNALESVRRLTATGLPSVCDPPKSCPGFDEFADAPVRHVLHHLTNSTAAELCVTAQLRLGCPSPFAGAFGVAAYVGEFRINQPCSNYLGDDGAAEVVPPPFSFRIPPGTNFLLVVTARDTNFLCATYALELFGLPCPPPTLRIATDAAPGKVIATWSSAYPDYRLQSANSLANPGPSSFGDVPTPPVLTGGKFAVTNSVIVPRQFFRLIQP
jgi:autotransporter-associated beta strand protein